MNKLSEYIKAYSSKKQRRFLVMALIVLVLLVVTAVFLFAFRNLQNSASVAKSEQESFTINSTETDVSDESTSTKVDIFTSTTGFTPVDETYYDDACFIGDSRSEGLMQYSGPAKATYYVYKGLTVDAAFTKAFISDNGSKVTVVEALKHHKFGKVYIMLGINELGWQYSSIFYDKYSKLIDTVKSSQPNAKIFVQSIFPVTAARSAQGDYVNNQKIQEYDTLIQKICAEKELYYLDIGKALLDASGNLPDDAAYDGVHLKKPYCDKWRTYLDTHTVVPVASMPDTTAMIIDTTDVPSTSGSLTGDAAFSAG